MFMMYLRSLDERILKNSFECGFITSSDLEVKQKLKIALSIQ
jgi:hypothetical protein